MEDLAAFLVDGPVEEIERIKSLIRSFWEFAHLPYQMRKTFIGEEESTGPIW